MTECLDDSPQDRATAGVTVEEPMRTGSGQAGGPPAAGQQAGLAVSSPPAATRLTGWHSDLAEWVDRLGWLRTLSDWLGGVLVPVRERHQDNLALELLHGGRWVGHPVHPALSDLPIGLWAGVTVLDTFDHDPALRRGIDAAGVLSAAGILAAGATALTGLGDWTVSNEQDRRVGLFHGLLNTVALGLQGASLGTRVAGHRGTARALGAASLTVTAAAGYLGGHLVFTKGVMVNRVAWTLGPRRWTRALPEADLPDDSPTAVEAEGRQILLYRQGGHLYAIDNVCSHAGGLLSRGPVADLAVICPLHGSRFGLADGCVSRGPASQPQPVIPTRIRNGWIEVRGSQPAPRRPASGRTQP
jgi:nitrite reductase/ring-hydroxylating ferredoxin subunit